MFFDRPDSGELAVLVHLEFSQLESSEDPREFEELVLAAGGDPVAFITGKRAMPTAKYFVGTGKLEEIRETVEQEGAQLVIFDHNLSPSQERNIEAQLGCRVLDRTGLILDIFAQRARTHEGKLQVELAQLRHMSTRLIRGWTHLERQKGGIGLRGPGETQLESDRRMLRERIQYIERRLDKVRKTRAEGRRSRTRASVPTVSLVGYTNAGKSTLFNRLANSDVFAANQLFATLDPTMRRIEVEDVGPVVLADTVGFISHLPHRLVEAFRATLEEAASADLLLHVVDASEMGRDEQIAHVDEVLEEIKANELPTLMVFNKIDLLGHEEGRIDRDEHGVPWRVWVSAVTGAGIGQLAAALRERLGTGVISARLELQPSQGRLRAELHNRGVVTSEEYLDNGNVSLDVKISTINLAQMRAHDIEADEAFTAAGHPKPKPTLF